MSSSFPQIVGGLVAYWPSLRGKVSFWGVCLLFSFLPSTGGFSLQDRPGVPRGARAACGSRGRCCWPKSPSPVLLQPGSSVAGVQSGKVKDFYFSWELVVLFWDSEDSRHKKVPAPMPCPSFSLQNNRETGAWPPDLHACRGMDALSFPCLTACPPPEEPMPVQREMSRQSIGQFPSCHIEMI